MPHGPAPMIRIPFSSHRVRLLDLESEARFSEQSPAVLGKQYRPQTCQVQSKYNAASETNPWTLSQVKAGTDENAFT